MDMCEIMCKSLHMATNLALDPDLLERALAVSGEKTKNAAVTKALKEFIARREQKRLRELFGRLEACVRREQAGRSLSICGGTASVPCVPGCRRSPSPAAPTS